MAFKIPSDAKTFSQTNKSDFDGNIWATRNMNFREKGYMKLSSRAVSIFSQKTDVSSQFRLPVDFFGSNDAYTALTVNKPMNFNISEASFTSVDNTVYGSAPTTSLNSRGVLYNGNFVVTTENGIYYTTGNNVYNYFASSEAGTIAFSSGNITVTGTGTSFLNRIPIGTVIIANGEMHTVTNVTSDTSLTTDAWNSSASGVTFKIGPSLQSGNPHPVEVFKTLGYIGIGDGSTVYFYDFNFKFKISVSIPLNYKITHLKYSNGRMAIVAMSTDEAVMFLTDGTSTVYDSAVPFGSDMAVGIVSYRNSWVVLNRRGQLLFFNGGSFEQIALMPYYSKNYLYGDYGTQYAIGSTMYVEGDFIYINIPTFLNVFGSMNQQYMPNYPGGIWCYDPAVGLTHRYAPSQSPLKQLTVQAAGVNVSTDTLTSLSSIAAPTGTPVKYTSDKTSPIGGLTPGKVYYIINLDGTNFRLALTYADSIAGIAVDITSTGAATNQFLSLNLVDYGISYTSGIQGGITMPSTHTLTHDHLVFGTQQYDTSSTNVYGNLDLTISGFKNIGYIVTPKLYSQDVTDKFQKVYIKYVNIKENDTIQLKYKDRHALGLPVSSTFGINNCTWTSENTFTTAKNFSSALSAYSSGIPLECDIIAGAGAGQLSQVSSVSFSAGVYTIVLADTIEGASAGLYCDTLIDNWTLIPQTATYADSNSYKEFSVQMSSTWHKYKVILSGTEIALEEIQVVNATQLPSKN